MTGDRRQSLAARYPHLSAEDIDRLRKELGRQRGRRRSMPVARRQCACCGQLAENGGSQRPETSASGLLHRSQRGGGGSAFIDADGHPLTREQSAQLPHGWAADLRARRHTTEDN